MLGKGLCLVLGGCLRISGKGPPAVSQDRPGHRGGGRTIEYAPTVLADLGAGLPAVRTRDLAQARAYLGGLFTGHDLIAAEPADMHFEHRHGALGDVSLNLVGYGTDVEVATSGLPDFYLCQATLAGDVRVQARAFDVRLPPGAVFVMNPGVPFRKSWTRDSRQLILKLPRRSVEEQLARDTEDDRLRPVTFAPVIADAAGEARALLRYVAAVCADLSDPGGLVGDEKVARAMERTVLSGILATLRHDRHDDRSRAVQAPAPRYVRRAEDFLRVHYAEPIGLDDVAAACGVSTRTLQEGLRQYRDTTPSGLLREVRLDAARALLKAGAASVTEVAFEVGFSHLSRFARAYAARFGESPSRTLRRGPVAVGCPIGRSS
ncbi:AraC family transcriptional regulator [Phreatobacter stygius]|uniref:AraC family transcriptional regulator n=1 Tax=Phreatobacter stygius TaxID=1940610 RepID=UPI0014778026|nr:AraC family transcriptional regulator [Phreatobacter stygius]